MIVPTFYCLLVILLIKTAASQDDEISRWVYGLRSLLKGCPPTPWPSSSDHKDFIPALRYCLQHRVVVAIDGLLTEDVIPILDGINLVRYQDLQFNTTDEEYSESDSKNEGEDKDSSESDKGWQSVVINSLTRLFRTHVLKIDLDQVSRATGLSLSNSEEEKDGKNGGQGRRHRFRRKGNMFPVMMMGFLLMGSILIPMGFQFLAVLGGKALILAKMALILSSIQGLKKIATSGVNYGLYHSPVSEGWHDRGHQQTGAPIELPYESYSRRLSSP